MTRFDQTVLIVVTVITGVLVGLLIAAEYDDSEPDALAWLAALGVVGVGYLAREAAFGLLLALPVAYVILLIAGADEPFAEAGDSTALGLLYTAILLGALVAAGNGLRWCVEWLRARSGDGGPTEAGA
jgi:hypothetical protein